MRNLTYLKRTPLGTGWIFAYEEGGIVTEAADKGTMQRLLHQYARYGTFGCAEQPNGRWYINSVGLEHIRACFDNFAACYAVACHVWQQEQKYGQRRQEAEEMHYSTSTKEKERERLPQIELTALREVVIGWQFQVAFPPEDAPLERRVAHGTFIRGFDRFRIPPFHPSPPPLGQNGFVSNRTTYEVSNEQMYFLSFFMSNYEEMEQQAKQQTTWQRCTGCCTLSPSVSSCLCHQTSYCAECYLLHTKKQERSAYTTFRTGSAGSTVFHTYDFGDIWHTRTSTGTRPDATTTATQPITLTAEQRAAFSLLCLTATAHLSEEDIRAAFRAQVKAASDGNGNYHGDMDKLVRAKETALTWLQSRASASAQKKGAK